MLLGLCCKSLYVYSMDSKTMRNEKLKEALGVYHKVALGYDGRKNITGFMNMQNKKWFLVKVIKGQWVVSNVSIYIANDRIKLKYSFIFPYLI